MTEPIGASSLDGGSSYRFLHAKDVTEVMRGSVMLAYPNPNHYMRINVNRICPHSNRVTAAVCLQKGGASNDDISFRLRWHPTTVPTYLRSCLVTKCTKSSWGPMGCMFRSLLLLLHSLVFFPCFFRFFIPSWSVVDCGGC